MVPTNADVQVPSRTIDIKCTNIDFQEPSRTVDIKCASSSRMDALDLNLKLGEVAAMNPCLELGFLILM